jgi:hypothetical protein
VREAKRRLVARREKIEYTSEHSYENQPYYALHYLSQCNSTLGNVLMRNLRRCVEGDSRLNRMRDLNRLLMMREGFMIGLVKIRDV